MSSSLRAPQTEYNRYVPEPRTMKRIGDLHSVLYRVTGGLVGGRVDGLDILLLTTIGRKTGQKRTVPLPYFRDGQRYVLIASFGGNEKNPAWFTNLSAQPDVRLQVGFRRLQARARVAEPTERARIWREITRDFPRYLVYQEKTERQIPIVLVERVLA